jgi:hypothetical protein
VQGSAGGVGRGCRATCSCHRASPLTCEVQRQRGVLVLLAGHLGLNGPECAPLLVDRAGVQRLAHLWATTAQCAVVSRSEGSCTAAVPPPCQQSRTLRRFSRLATSRLAAAADALPPLLLAAAADAGGSAPPPPPLLLATGAPVLAALTCC